VAAKTEEGRSMMKNIESFEIEKRHEYEKKKAHIYREFSHKEGIVFSGQSGEGLIAQLFDFGDKKEDK